MGLNRVAKEGLSLEQHRALGHRLRGVKAELLAVRTTIKASLGSATAAYQAATRSLAALQALENALAQEAAVEYVDQVPLAQLQTLYGDGAGR